MKTQKRTVLYIGIACVLALTFTFVIQPRLERRSIAASGDDTLTTYLVSLDLMPNLFREPFEIIYFITKYGQVFGFTTHTDGAVRIPIANIVSYLESKGCDVPDIILIVHNHWNLPRFSESDIRSFWDLRRRGLRGYYAIYVQSNRRIVFYDDDNK